MTSDHALRELDLMAVKLVVAVTELGSIGAAAGRLQIAQPSASQRLALLERRLGVRLFDRDTRGARPTPAGEAFAERAARALELLEEAASTARSPQGGHLSVGTIGSLAAAVFPALLTVVPEVEVRQVTNHGRVLATAVGDGALDAAVIGLGRSAAPARGIVRTKLGGDGLVVVRPATAAAGAGPQRVGGATVVAATYSDDGARVEARLARLGATTVTANGTLTALAMARQQGWLAAVPRTTALRETRDDEEAWPLRIPIDAPVWLVTRGRRADVLVERAALLARQIGLR